MTRQRLFGVGVYDLAQVVHLLGVDERTIRRWSSETAAGEPALVPPTHGWAFSFHDLLSLMVVAVLRQRGVSRRGVAATIKELTREFGYERPLAHRDVVDGIATAGRSVISEDGVDLSASGQRLLLATVERYIQPIEYDGRGLARLWKPAKHVMVDPEIQVGHPCIEWTRITTDTIAGRHAQGERLELIADDLEVTVEQAKAAIKFEQRLDSGHGLARVA